MKKVLISAYACSPTWGSEPGMGWNWIVNIAKFCKVYVITEGEWKDEIESALLTLPQKNNIRFYYNPVSDDIRKMCWNQGDYRFYYYYKKWQKKTYKIAVDIIKKNNIDIIHQLNMIGFREPGYLWRINDIPFVWGPIGGMENIPLSYLKNESCSLKMFVTLKNILNTFQYRYSSRVNKAINAADLLISAVKGVQDKIYKYHNANSILISETGCFIKALEINKKEKDTFDIIWVGKFDFRKQLGLALNTISELRTLPNIRFHIIGAGSEKNEMKYKKMAYDLGINDICIWYGSISNIEVQNIMQKSDIFFFTSIMEATSTVVLEALSNKLPVVCFNTCGFGSIIDESVGSKVELSIPYKSKKDFSQKIKYLYDNKRILSEMSDSCITKQKELSWEEKAIKIVEHYNQILEHSK